MPQIARLRQGILRPGVTGDGRRGLRGDIRAASSGHPAGTIPGPLVFGSDALDFHQAAVTNNLEVTSRTRVPKGGSDR